MKVHLKFPGGEIHIERDPAPVEKFWAVCALLGGALYVALTWIIVSMNDFFAFLWHLSFSAGLVVFAISMLRQKRS